MNIKNDLLIKHSEQFGVELSISALEKLNIFAEMLVEKNKKINLTSITEPDDIVIKHFADSLSIFSVFKPQKNARIIDVGTGAGFPGIVMCIVRPDLNITMIDSTNKKLDFVREVCDELGLTANVIHCRAEEAGQRKELRETFDLSVARAVANLKNLSEYCLPFVKVGGAFIAMKSAKAENETKEGARAVKLLGGKIKGIYSVDLGEEYTRNLVYINKISQTPPKYPRCAAQIARKPLE
ncbi:MAG TPA: 16S rRNA (guanine(527)-N(7))-methyltransferase RsmG [Clostridia bacterium]|nr:16S rRNA (guanine(527)-N(7))-methyltransferase RsmG [Clostridia bacterium]